MSQQVWSGVDDYFAEMLLPADAALDAALQAANAAGLPQHNVAPNQGKLLVIVVDNIVRDGAVTNASSTDPNVQGVRRFLELVAAEPRLSATALQTVGSKGYDGFAIAIVMGKQGE